MVVSEIMQKDFFTVKPSESLEVTAKKMREKQLPVAVVLDAGHVKGILTENQITKAAGYSRSALAADAHREPTVHDDENRCCYFNEVQVELLLNG